MTSQPGQQGITTHLLINILRIKGKQTMKIGQLIEHPKRNFSLKIMQKMWQGNCSQTTFCFLKNFILGKIKWSAA